MRILSILQGVKYVDSSPPFPPWRGQPGISEIKFLRRAGTELYCPINGYLRGTLVSRKILVGGRYLERQRCNHNLLLQRCERKNCLNPGGKVEGGYLTQHWRKAGTQEDADRNFPQEVTKQKPGSCASSQQPLSTLGCLRTRAAAIPGGKKMKYHQIVLQPLKTLVSL